MTELEHVPCDLCGCEQYRVRYTKPDNSLRRIQYQFPVVECFNCGLVYVNPRPTMRAMADFYPSGYYSGRDAGAFVSRYGIQRSLLPDISGKRVLDIGCARGHFLSYLLNSGLDFDPYGVDAFSGSVCDPRISFSPDLFTNVGYESDFFDLVMSWAVFEHLHNPTSYFHEARRVLKRGAKLIILVTNSNSMYGRYAFAEDVPRHTYHYSPSTLRRYGEKVRLALRAVDFRDDVFDGRGIGTFRFLLGRAFGFTWEKSMLNELQMHHRIAMRMGGILDRIIFATHWEARLGLSGVMVATYEKD